MAAILRQGTKRIGGSVLRRTQSTVTSPAVAEERRRLVPTRRMHSTEEEAQAMQEIQRMKEELYVALSKVENWRHVSLLQDLAAHVKPRPHENQWRRLRASRRNGNYITTIGIAGIGLAVGQAIVKRASTLQKNKEQ